MACSSHGASTSAAIDPSGIARPESLHSTLSPRPPRASMPSVQSARSSSESVPRPARVLDDHDEVAVVLQPLGAWPPADRGGSSPRTTDRAPASARSTSADGSGSLGGAHRADAAKAGRRQLPVECGHRLGHRVGGRQAADDGVGVAVGVGPPVEFEGLVDRVPAGGGGDVDQLLDVPAGGLGEVGGRRRSGATSPRRRPCSARVWPREVRVPVGAGRIPQVDVGVDDAGGLGRSLWSSRLHHLSERVVEPPRAPRAHRS